MKKTKISLMVIFVFSILVPFSFSQLQEMETSRPFSLRPEIGFEYFNRTISWDGEDIESSLKSYIFTFNANFEIQNGFWAGVILGYSLSNFDDLLFRKIPFSVELQTGSAGGFLFGGQLTKNFINSQSFEIDVMGQFVYYLGAEEEWEIPGLNVNGTAKGKPNWLRGIIGLNLKYTEFDYFKPYLLLSYNRLQGTYSMKQTIQELTGSEEKKITGKSKFSTAVGIVYDLSQAFNIKAEVIVMPYSGGVDLGFMIGAFYSL